MFTCVFSAHLDGRLSRSLFDIHRIPVLILLYIFYLDAFNVSFLHPSFSRYWWHDASRHCCGRLCRLLDFPRYSMTKRSDLVQPGSVLIPTWFALYFSLWGIPKETFQAGPHFVGVQPIRPCAELANGAFDDGIPRLLMSTKFLRF